jgi:hypothetical protein
MLALVGRFGPANRHATDGIYYGVVRAHSGTSADCQARERVMPCRVLQPVAALLRLQHIFGNCRVGFPLRPGLLPYRVVLYTSHVLLRRLAGAVMSVLLLQPNLGSRDLSCGTHEGDAAVAAHHVAPDGPQRAGGLHASAEPVPEEAPCDMPIKRDCCQTFSSCSVAFEFSSTAVVAPLAVHAPAIAAPAGRPPAYLIRPPEPPPPKV